MQRMSYYRHLLSGFTYAECEFSLSYIDIFPLSYIDDVSFCARVGTAFWGL